MKEPFLSDKEFLADLESVRRRAGAVDLWWLGQSGYLVHHREQCFLIDPYLSDSLTAKYSGTDKPHVRISRRVVDPTAMAMATGLPVTVTCSHSHTDHLDPDTLRALGPIQKLIFPKPADALAKERIGRSKLSREIRLEGADDGSRHQIGPGIMVHGIASAHESVERDEAGNCKFLGYVFEFSQPWLYKKEFTLYHSGDTVVYDGLVEKLRPFNIDVAILPINGRSPERRVAGNLNGREAAWLAKEIGAKLVIPCHYDMFEFNTASPEEFVAECERLGQAYRVLKLGERWSSSELKG
jgi:L-ascorbate metabolism protein UlaG (beta-lactamase superfamily)